MDNRKLSIVVPTYNRYEMTIESFSQVLQDERVSEIVIVDDCSTDDSYSKLIEYFKSYGLLKFGKGEKWNPDAKICMYSNPANQDCYWNKKIAVEHATNDYCILLDSDNIIGPGYIDAIYNNILQWTPNFIYQPVFAKPHFDFRKFSDNYIHRGNINSYINDNNFTTALNAMNFFVNRKTYLDAFDPSIDPVTSDSIYMAYRLLEQGNIYYFVPGLEYEHRLHDGSHYKQNVHRTATGFHQSILDKLAQL